MTLQRGFEPRLYRLTNGPRSAWPASGAPENLEEIVTAGDISLDHEANELTATRRGVGYETVFQGLKKASLELTFVYDPADTHLMALRDAYFQGATVALAVLDGDKDTVDTKGFWADWVVTKFADGAPIDDAHTVTITLRPDASSTVPPEAVEVQE